ncbi:hypothetical protein BGZ96_000853 [Linnemannia gamsii]|uniref:BTB domain-containing protein n=1 Tax=Linnemannia gamsii TaxID=64522 RepID=A0ABQ7JN95_9FUNG|nr:hypothetical protein BGZ96_000853 [Linnemannia gamsii]
MSNSTLVQQTETILSITSPALQINKSKTIHAGSDGTCFKWSVFLEKTKSSFYITVQLPQASLELENDKELMVDGGYSFDIVFSTGLSLTRASVPSLAQTSVPSLTQTSISSLARTSVPLSPKKDNRLLRLLKDTHSVDTCFVFPSNKAYSNIGLWAHRSILSSYESFAKLIQAEEALQAPPAFNTIYKDKEGVKVESSGEKIHPYNDTRTEERISAVVEAAAATTIAAAEARALVIKVEGHSLATMCALLYYIYSDDIDLVIDTSNFMISNNSSLVWYDNATGKIQDSVRWSPFDHDSPWKLKDVTWKELKEAAVHYNLEDLEALADKGLQSDM